MLKTLLRKVFPSEGRISTRRLVSASTQCLVLSPKFPEKLPVYLGDISTSGLSFFSKNPWFQMDDGIEILLLNDARFVELKGPIVSQKIFYPHGSEDLKHAIYRYSMRFSNALSQEWVERFSKTANITKADP